MNIDPEKPDKPDRAILIMSKGHASPAESAALALRGYVPVELLEGFRKVNSKLEGHVHRGIPGVESSTGSLGNCMIAGVPGKVKRTGEQYFTMAHLNSLEYLKLNKDF